MPHAAHPTDVLFFSCGRCQTELSVPVVLQGVEGPCPACGAMIRAPQCPVPVVTQRVHLPPLDLRHELPEPVAAPVPQAVEEWRRLWQAPDRNQGKAAPWAEVLNGKGWMEGARTSREIGEEGKPAGPAGWGGNGYSTGIPLPGSGAAGGPAHEDTRAAIPAAPPGKEEPLPRAPRAAGKVQPRQAGPAEGAGFQAKRAIPPSPEPEDSSWQGRVESGRRRQAAVRRLNRAAGNLLDSTAFRVARVALLVICGGLCAGLWLYLKDRKWVLELPWKPSTAHRMTGRPAMLESAGVQAPVRQGAEEEDPVNPFDVEDPAELEGVFRSAAPDPVSSPAAPAPGVESATLLSPVSGGMLPPPALPAGGLPQPPPGVPGPSSIPASAAPVFRIEGPGLHTDAASETDKTK